MSGTAEQKLASSLHREGQLFSRFSLRTLIVVAMALAFAAGTVSGALLGSRFATDRIRTAASNPKSHVDQVFNQLDQQLAFSEQQRSLASEILDRHFANSEKIRRENLPEVLAEFDRFVDELFQVLDDEQKNEWEKQSQWIRRNCYGVEDHPAID